MTTEKKERTMLALHRVLTYIITSAMTFFSFIGVKIYNKIDDNADSLNKLVNIVGKYSEVQKSHTADIDNMKPRLNSAEVQIGVLDAEYKSLNTYFFGEMIDPQKRRK